MKLGEAILEREHLEDLLERLESRLRRDTREGRPLNHILQEIERAANRRRDLRVAIEWTLQQVAISGATLGSYMAKGDQLQKVADILENVDSPDLREKVDELLEAKKETDRLLEAVSWAQDLLIPDIKVPKSDTPEEEN